MQVGVPKALQAYLDGAEESSIAWELNTREDSPFFGKISHTRMKPDQLFMLHSVAKNVKRSFAHGSLEDLPEDEKTEALIYYWNAIKETNATQLKDIELSERIISSNYRTYRKHSMVNCCSSDITERLCLRQRHLIGTKFKKCELCV